MMRRVYVVVTALALSAVSTVANANAQEVPAVVAAQALTVFLDCNVPNCDFNHFRREITWVNWMRDRTDADVHLLITVQSTGGGGWHYTLAYIGSGRFEGVSKTLAYVSDPDDTDTEVRDGLTQTMGLGLVQFVEASPVAPRLRVVYDAPETAPVGRNGEDPWNLWVFELSLSGSVESEAQQDAYSLRGSIDADRVAENIKVNFGLSGRYNRDEYEMDDGDMYIDVSEDYSANLLLVWSLGDNWSVGGKANANHSTYLNRDLALSAGPAIEYDIFPYAESTRRQITFRYAVEAASFNYKYLTVEGKMDEILPRHSLTVAAAVQQPWGEVYGSIEGIQYLHDPKTHRINTDARWEYRLFRGFSLDISGEFSRIKDQFYLSSEELSGEEILTERYERETDYSFDFSIGFSYRFGSRFANIVNPRMGGGQGQFFRR